MVSLAFASGRSEWSEPSVCLRVGRVAYAFNVPGQSERAWMQERLPTRIRKVFATGPLQAEQLMEFNIGQQMLSEVRLSLVGAESARGTVVSGSVMHRASLFECQLDADYEDDWLKVDTIPLGRTVALSAHVKMKQKKPGFDRVKIRSMSLSSRSVHAVHRHGSIKLSNGLVVTAKDIELDEDVDVAPKKVLFIECLSLGDLDNLVSVDLEEYSVIVHFTDVAVLGTPEYIAKFPKSAINICFVPNGTRNVNVTDPVYSELQWGLSDMFPPLSAEVVPCDVGHFVVAGTGDRVIWSMGKPSLDRRACIVSECSPVFPECPTYRVTMLGTSAGFVCTAATTASIMLQIPDGFILLDAGRGCLSQMQVQYGYSNIGRVLRELRGIWMSHFHIDHVEGLFRVLAKRREFTDKEIVIACCDAVWNEVRRVEDVVYGKGFFRLAHVDRNEVIALGSASIRSFPMEHTVGSMACVITLATGTNIGYTGDYVFRDSLVDDFGRLDLLISEGTYGDDRLKQAISRGHSTWGQAIRLGRATGAKHTIVTHYSTRFYWQHLCVGHKALDDVVFAFDHLSVSGENINDVFQAIRTLY